VFARDISERRNAEAVIQKKNEELEAINEELRATIEELEATNEEFEAQNQELINAQEKLEKSQERLKYALDATSDGLWDYTIQTGVCYFSPRYYRMIGYEPGEFKASYESWREMLHPDDAEAAVETLKKHIEGENEQYQAEFRFRGKTGAIAGY
jgi:PAS domain S-box-containing protein